MYSKKGYINFYFTVAILFPYFKSELSCLLGFISMKCVCGCEVPAIPLKVFNDINQSTHRPLILKVCIASSEEIMVINVASGFIISFKTIIKIL